MTQRTVHRLAQTMTIVALDRFLGSLHIILLGLEDEANLIVVEVDNMNTVTLHEDVRSHCWIPLATEVSEVATCLK